MNSDRGGKGLLSEGGLCGQREDLDGAPGARGRKAGTHASRVEAGS